jgi:hypothetical protein
MRSLYLCLPIAAGLFLALGSMGGCAQSPPPDSAPAPWFEDVTDQVGLNFVHDPGPLPTAGKPYFLPQIIGSGCALFDFDGDGLLDIYLLQNGGPDSSSTNRLFRQLPNGRFQDVSAGSGLDIAGYNMGVAIGDVNNDGRPDVLVTQYGGIKLFLNNGDGTFTDVTKESGLDNPGWGTSASFIDYNRDGWLDLVVVNYVDYDPTEKCERGGWKADYCHPRTFPGTVTRLFRNRGRVSGSRNNLVTFEDVTLTSGLGTRPAPGLGVICADFNGDGWPDIFVANDAHANHLWINQQNGKFTEEATLRGLAYNGMGQPEGNMGIALGDVDGDGRMALLVTHLTEETNTLWKEESPGQFKDQTHAAGLTGSRWRGTGFGTVLGDFDLDGSLDLAVVNGRVSRRPTAQPTRGESFWEPYTERNQLFANDGAGRFRDISESNSAFCGHPAVARGLACGVLRKHSGALDLLVTNVGGRARLYRNVAPRAGHWLLVRAVDGEHGGRDAYGAVVTVRAGKKKWVRWVNPGSSYLSSNDPRAHFGLGPVTRVDAIDVRWPDGKTQTFPGTNVDRSLRLVKKKSRP